MLFSPLKMHAFAIRGWLFRPKQSFVEAGCARVASICCKHSCKQCHFSIIQNNTACDAFNIFVKNYGSTPFMASKTLRKNHVKFHLTFVGQCKSLLSLLRGDCLPKFGCFFEKSPKGGRSFSKKMQCNFQQARNLGKCAI